jgi:hypothetical protein
MDSKSGMDCALPELGVVVSYRSRCDSTKETLRLVTKVRETGFEPVTEGIEPFHHRSITAQSPILSRQFAGNCPVSGLTFLLGWQTPAPPYRITSSAWKRSVGGIVIPSAWAVLPTESAERQKAKGSDIVGLLALRLTFTLADCNNSWMDHRPNPHVVNVHPCTNLHLSVEVFDPDLRRSLRLL